MTRALLDQESLRYGQRTILSPVTFSLSPGDRVVFLGQSGAGKTTLLNAIYDRLQQQQRVALVPQDHALVPQLSAARNVLMGRLDQHNALYNLSNFIRIRRHDRAEVADILEQLGLRPEIDKTVETLSGGQKQRVALARAVYCGGATLIGDEPVSAVDETRAAQMLTLIRGRFQSSILALHDVALAQSFATRLIGIAKGRIQFDAPPAAVEARQIAALYDTA